MTITSAVGVRVSPLIDRVTTLRTNAYNRYIQRRFPRVVYEAAYFMGNVFPACRFLFSQARRISRAIEQKVLREMREDGISIVHIDDLIDDAKFTLIQKWAEALLSRPSNQQRIRLIESGARPEAMSGKYFLIRMLGDIPVFDLADPAMTVCLSPAVLRIVSGYLGVPGRMSAVEYWYNIPTVDAPVMSQRWHRDPEDKRMIKIFLHLRDVGPQNGPLEYVPGSQNDGRYRAVRPDHRRLYPGEGFVERNFAPDQIRTCVGKAGTLVFADVTGFHRGGKPQQDGRLLFNAAYTTNGSIPLTLRRRLYEIAGEPCRPLHTLARYAVGHVRR